MSLIYFGPPFSGPAFSVNPLVFLGVVHAHTARGWGSALSNFRCSFLFLRTPFDANLPSLTWVSHVHARRGRGPSATQFWGSLRFMCTTVNAELLMWRDNTYRKGVCF